MPGDDYFAELADERRPLIATKLTELSGLDSREAEVFRRSWAAIPLRRRMEIVQKLVELAEDNVELDHSAVFFVALDDEDPAIRLAAIQGLWEYEGRDLIDPLIRMMREDPEPGVRSAAALALGQFALLAEFQQLRGGDVERVDDALRNVVENDIETIEVRARAVESIGARGEPWARDIIEDAYNSGSPRLRVSAIHAMGRSCDPEWLGDLFDNLDDHDPEVRYEAILACGAIADESASEYLALRIDDDDAEVRLAAIAALGAIGGDEAEAALRTHVNSEDEAVRDAVREALTEIREMRDLLDFRAGE